MEKEFKFIERIRKLGVKTNDTPAIIGVDLVIFEFKEFIRLLKAGLHPDNHWFVDKLVGDKLITK